MNIPLPEWKSLIIGSIDGLERQLGSSASKRARSQLGELRECASKAATAKARKLCERRLDSLAESSPCFRGAARRYVLTAINDSVERVLKAFIKVARVRGNRKAERGITKLLVDFDSKKSTDNPRA
jgi:hypothetical protein